jgi:hypothetical protein
MGSQCGPHAIDGCEHGLYLSIYNHRRRNSLVRFADLERAVEMDRRNFLSKTMLTLPPVALASEVSQAWTGTAMRRKRRPSDIAVLLTSNGSSAAAGNVTYSGLSFGSAFSDRVIVALVGAQTDGPTGRYIQGVTIGGYAATGTWRRTSAALGTQVVGIYAAVVPTGTTGDLFIDFNSAVSFASYTIVVLQNVLSVSATNRVDSNSVDVTRSLTLDCPAGGICFAVVNSNRDSSSATWTGLTENDDITYNTNQDLHTTAYSIFSTYQTGVTPSVTLAGTADAVPRGAMMAASYR